MIREEYAVLEDARYRALQEAPDDSPVTMHGGFMMPTSFVPEWDRLTMRIEEAKQRAVAEGRLKIPVREEYAVLEDVRYRALQEAPDDSPVTMHGGFMMPTSFVPEWDRLTMQIDEAKRERRTTPSEAPQPAAAVSGASARQKRVGAVLGFASFAAAMFGGASSKQRRPSAQDRIVGDGGNVTVYQRSDGSQYALDRHGRYAALRSGTRIYGPAKFDSRGRAR